MADDPLRRWMRRIYLDEHQRRRRADLKAEGARRIDVTLRGQMLDDYETVRRYLEGMNRYVIEQGIWGPNGRIPGAEFRLSSTEVIKTALDYAASGMREEAAKNDKAGLVNFLADY